MRLDLSEQQLNKFTKKDLLQMLLTSLENEKNLEKKLDAVTLELKQTNQQLQLLLEKWNLSQAERFGRSTEKNLIDNNYEQMELAAMYAQCFNEAEATVAGTEPEEPEMEQIEVSSHKRRKTKGKREDTLQNIPHEIVMSEVSVEELQKTLGSGYRRLPDEVFKRLEFIPASFKVKEYHIAVYVSKDGKKFLRAERPEKDLFRNSIATASLLASILNYKYVNAMPIHRLSQDFQRNDLSISPQVMCNWVIRGSEIYLSLIYDELKKHLMEHPVIQADETTLKVTKDGRAAGTPSYMWTYLTGEHDPSGQKIVIYDYQKTRATEHPKEFLDGYKGAIVSDGYVSYQVLSRETGITAAGCWMHCRRRFANAIKAAKKDLTDEQLKNTVASKALTRIGAIYKLEESWKHESSENRLENRQKILRPLVDEYFQWVREQLEKNTVLPKSETGEGLTYSINQEKYLREFLNNGDIPIDNGAAERAIRPFCVGRRNWNIIDTVAGAKASAIAYSIAETAKANNLKPYQYFRYLLTELPKRIDMELNDKFSLDDLMPWSEDLPLECKKNV